MSTNHETLLCRYHYDPLDRLATCTPSAQASTQRFYLRNRLATETQGSVQRSIFQQEDQLLAQQQRQGGTVETTLLATDQQRSVLHALDVARPHPLAYTPYGHRTPENGLLSLLGFNGERPDPVTRYYLLGNGYRAFNPVLMRFNSPDSWSPFGKGGLNAYAYCVGDPVNRSDPTGHFPNFFKGLLNILGLRTPRLQRALTRSKEVVTTTNTTNIAPATITDAPANTMPVAHARPATALGAFGKIQGAPHILENIVGHLPGSDIVSFASTSQTMKQITYSMAKSPSSLLTPGQTRLSLERVQSAAQGSINGVLPAPAIGMLNAYQENKGMLTKFILKTNVDRVRAAEARMPAPVNGRRRAVYLPD